ncbi:MAG: glutamate--tRNA ligase, partial [Phycisphaerales bacterium]
DTIAAAEWNAASLESRLTAFCEAKQVGNIGKVAQPLRIAVSGGTVSPPIFDTLAMLGRASTLARIERCLGVMRG